MFCTFGLFRGLDAALTAGASPTAGAACAHCLAAPDPWPPTQLLPAALYVHQASVYEGVGHSVYTVVHKRAFDTLYAPVVHTRAFEILQSVCKLHCMLGRVQL